LIRNYLFFSVRKLMCRPFHPSVQDRGGKEVL
jgi:hypothetical protein